MSPDRISPSSSMLEWVRAMGLGRQARAGKHAPVSTSERQDAPAHDPVVLHQQLQSLVGAVDPDDADAMRTLRRPVLQAVVLWEFGEGFRHHPEFGAMLEGIEATLEADPKAQARLVALVRQLRK